MTEAEIERIRAEAMADAYEKAATVMLQTARRQPRENLAEEIAHIAGIFARSAEKLRAGDEEAPFFN